MSNKSTKTVKGRVTGSLFGVCTNIAYEDGCHRPGDIGLEVGSVITSEAEVVNGICEHFDVTVVNTRTPIAKPQSVVQPMTQQPKAQPKSITVEDILTAREKPKRLPLPEIDPPVDPAIIQQAKIPPKIKSNPATAPVRNTAALPVENIFDGDITGLTPEEIAELRGGVSSEPISTGKPMSPFAQDFDTGRKPAVAPVRRGNKPTSVFDL